MDRINLIDVGIAKQIFSGGSSGGVGQRRRSKIFPSSIHIFQNHGFCPSRGTRGGNGGEWIGEGGFGQDGEGGETMAGCFRRVVTTVVGVDGLLMIMQCKFSQCHIGL